MLQRIRVSKNRNRGKLDELCSKTCLLSTRSWTNSTYAKSCVMDSVRMSDLIMILVRTQCFVGEYRGSIIMIHIPYMYEFAECLRPAYL